MRVGAPGSRFSLISLPRPLPPGSRVEFCAGWRPSARAGSFEEGRRPQAPGPFSRPVGARDPCGGVSAQPLPCHLRSESQSGQGLGKFLVKFDQPVRLVSMTWSVNLTKGFVFVGRNLCPGRGGRAAWAWASAGRSGRPLRVPTPACRGSDGSERHRCSFHILLGAESVPAAFRAVPERWFLETVVTYSSLRKALSQHHSSLEATQCFWSLLLFF